MIPSFHRLVVILCLLIPPPGLESPLPQRDQDTSATAQLVQRMNRDSLDALLRNTYSPVTAARKLERRVLQRKAYAGMLFDLIRSDGLSALITATKYRMQYDYSLPHDTLYLIRPVPRFNIPGIPIPEDWSWPEDPWLRDGGMP